MENLRGAQEWKNPSPLSSPHSNGSTNNGGNALQIHTPPISAIPISRSETNPYPTTFVQADSTNFKQVVQMLTGSSETAKQASNPPPPQPQDPSPSRSYAIPPVKTSIPKKQSFKLYERRNSKLKNSLMINTFLPAGIAGSPRFSPRNPPEILSPSILDFPKLVLSSPVTPLNEDPFNKSSASSSEEDKAIAERGFFLHPSPLSTPRDAEPQLLSLFPVTSPKVSGFSS